MLRILLAFIAVAAYAQQVGAPAGDNAGAYNIVQSWELGYRFATIGGNEDVYRSQVNYLNGIRLLNSDLTIHSKDNRNRYFDELVLTTRGLGNDPYESVMLRLKKNRLYRYDLLWRRNDYFNPGLTIAEGLHFRNTRRYLQDHDLTLFPQSHYRLRLGYSRNTESGPTLSTEYLSSEGGGLVPLFADVRRSFDDYRLGGDIIFPRVRLTLLQRWEFYKEDTPYQQQGAVLTAGTTNPPALASFHGSEPLRGFTPTSLVSLFAENSRFSFNARGTYAKSADNFLIDETSLGTSLLFGALNRETLVTGDARRVVATGDATLTWFAAPRLTVVNSTSVYNTRIDGSNALNDFDFATLQDTLLNFQFLGIRLITNSTDARYQHSRKFSVYAGYRYSNRLIRSITSITSPGFPFDNTPTEQTNQLHAGVLGINWRPISPLTLHVEGEVGRNDNPFFPVSDKNYHAVDARARYRFRQLQATAGYRQFYNNNSIAISAYSSRSRNTFADASWAVRPGISLDASYSHLHLDTIGGIAYFAGSPRALPVTGQQSVYISNIHAANLGLRVGLPRAADLFLGYSITRDAGDGRGAPGPDFLTRAQTFPLTFQSPLARLSVRITERIRWNAGYQYYGYKEDFGLFGVNQNYRASTGYSSILWAF